MTDRPKCELCGEPMPAGEEMFNYHGYSGPCPKPAQPAPSLSARWQELFWALPPGEMRHKLRALEIDTGRALRDELLRLLKIAQPEFCSMHCPSIFRGPDSVRHGKVCDEMRAAIHACGAEASPTVDREASSEAPQAGPVVNGGGSHYDNPATWAKEASPTVDREASSSVQEKSEGLPGTPGQGDL
jgi:hypothetical protein